MFWGSGCSGDRPSACSPKKHEMGGRFLKSQSSRLLSGIRHTVLLVGLLGSSYHTMKPKKYIIDFS